jgi:hypothetical protein
MMRSFVGGFFALFTLWTVVTAAANPAAAGCPPLEEPRPLPRPPIPDGLTVDPPIDTREACPAWRWVAVQRDTDTPCPEPEPVCDLSWIVKPLFAAVDTAELPPALRPFCLYEVETGDAEAREALNRNLERLLLNGDLREVESGCAAVGPMQGGGPKPATGNEAIRPMLESHFLAQTEPVAMATNRSTSTAVDDPSKNSYPGGGGPSAPPRVRVALLDTQPTGHTGGPGNSDHGFTLARIVERLVCRDEDGGGCAARIVPRLALPISDFAWDDPRATTFDWQNGGYFGTIDQLAQAVWEELGAWRGSGEEHLVLNLSVGWVGERFGGLERRVERMPVPVRATYRALQVASCRGALVVAASGNRVGGPEIETGPLLPGGWEWREAPDRRACRKLLGEEALGAAPAGGGGPLVYAAGGIHGDGQPLVNARPESEPSRVAYADHAVVGGEEGGATSILTGSSVATSVVASAAAVVWHHRPELSRAEVMALVWGSGESLERRADLHPGSTPPAVRRIAVCPALAHACRDGGGRCAEVGPVSCPEMPRDPPELSEIPPSCTTVTVDAAQLFVAGETVAGHDFCDTETLHFDPEVGEPPDPCPFRQYFGVRARPWTAPQPETNPCSGCDIRPPPDQGGGGGFAPIQTAAPSVDGAAQGARKPAVGLGHRLVINIDPRWTGGLLKAPILGIGNLRFALDLDPMRAGDCALVEGIDPSLLEPGADDRRPPTALYFRTDEGSVECPLFLGR